MSDGFIKKKDIKSRNLTVHRKNLAKLLFFISRETYIIKNTLKNTLV